MASAPGLPSSHPRIVTDPTPDPDGRLGTRSTACWRGYIGTWQVEDDRLYLAALEGRYRLVGPRLFAEWFTGLLRVPQGPVSHYVHMGFETTFERELYLQVVDGVVVDREMVNDAEG